MLIKDESSRCKVSWEFLEANEAKNESDTIGGFSKTALKHTILRDPDIVIQTSDDLVNAIKKGLEKSSIKSEKYSFIHVEAIPSFDRAKACAEIPIPGIQSLHSFTVLKGGILASQLSCHKCSVGAVCESCHNLELTVSSEEVEQAVDELRELLDEDDSEDDLEIEDDESESEDDCGSDLGDEESDVDASEEEVSLSDPGSIVWVF